MLKANLQDAQRTVAILNAICINTVVISYGGYDCDLGRNNTLKVEHAQSPAL